LKASHIKQEFGRLWLLVAVVGRQRMIGGCSGEGKIVRGREKKKVDDGKR